MIDKIKLKTKKTKVIQKEITNRLSELSRHHREDPDEFYQEIVDELTLSVLMVINKNDVCRCSHCNTIVYLFDKYCRECGCRLYTKD